jgi:uncharacterized protein YlxW (UPF0749 family)
MSDSDTQAVLRDVCSQVAALTATVKLMTDTWRLQEAGASAGRKEVYQKLEAVKDQVTSLENEVGGLSKEVAVIAPSVKAFDNAVQQAKGAKTLGKIIWGLIGLSGMGIGWVLANWISITPKIPPH